MATYSGSFKQDGKIWSTIGGGSIATPTAGTPIKGDALVMGADGAQYMHLTAPKVGYTKTGFLTYTTDGVIDPPPPPPVPSAPADIDIVLTKGGTVTVKDASGKILFSYVVP
jgi:hypothetical protein